MSRLLCDSMLGHLARWLRLLGYDAPQPKRLPAQAAPGEALLTRRRAWQGRPGVVFILHDLMEDQLRQVLCELELTPDPSRFFSRCLDCNVPVQPLAREHAAGRVPDYILDTAEGFTHCPSCGKVFWPGSHGKRAQERLTAMLGQTQSGVSGA
ncbi:MAG: Mut7-C RNAse domain-containing protein [Desulfarculaceae bacterium]|nr:Mut7-C RNAse domain-containing protein [Desulfarculaceae bacterium]MCF8066699.1 Mut7-C RNAse domain-containing protein [Desulfarculaceae bacterium]MCF8096788.1 Mut7-C RNAse domain-containing protein [Desulfarculaceae bacterium]MCF8122604.1 Mut7-C RNAse domain-containing protein [Desulfarculaceae bacterium]